MRGQILVTFLLLQSMVACQQSADSLKLATASLAPKESGQSTPKTANQGILYRSTDGGQTVQDISASLPRSFRAGGLYAEEEYLVLSSDQGLMLSRTAIPEPVWEQSFLPQVGISGVYDGQQGPYARSYYGNMYQNISGTAIWRPVFKELEANGLNTIVEIRQDHIIASSEKGIFKTTDGGKSWKQVSADGFVWKLKYWDGILLAGNQHGLLRSDDEGETWKYALKNGLQTQDIAILGDRLVYISDNIKPWKGNMEPDDIKNQVYISDDKGKTWTQTDFGLFDFSYVYDTEKRPQVRFIHHMAQVGPYLFCSADSGVFRSADKGETWELLFPVTDNIMYDLTVSDKVIYIIKNRALGGC
jgi:BNR/Asp-box repeat